MTETAEPGSLIRNFVVPLEEGDLASYELRGLREEEVPDWTEFCAHVFRYKANAPNAAYFAHHYFNDPDRDAALIRVALHDDSIVASCRVFFRKVSLGNGKSVAAGGIGEVCTADDHRRRGLSAQLLQDAVACMQALGITLSLLHSAPVFFPVYEKSGFVCTTSNWSKVTIDCQLLDSKEELKGALVRHARFPDDTEQLAAIHQTYSEPRFVGCIVRSKEYWDLFISQELHGTLWVLENRDDRQILGWISIRFRGDRYQLREFGCKNVESVPAVFRQLLKNWLMEEVNRAAVESVKLHMPTAVYMEVRSAQDSSDYLTDVQSDNDLGWMYKQLVGDALSLTEYATRRPHLIWPADSF